MLIFRAQWIPPQMYDQDDNQDLVLKRQAIDKKYCGGPCRFILPVFIMEQGKRILTVIILIIKAVFINKQYRIYNTKKKKSTNLDYLTLLFLFSKKYL